MENVQNPDQAGMLSPDFIAEREQYWLPFTKPVIGGCGDDRPATAKSTAEFQERFPECAPLSESYASIYGGSAGVAKNIIITGLSQHGEAFIQTCGGFDAVHEQVIDRTNADTSPRATKFVLHSAEGNENEDGSFCMQGEEATGCAYAGGVGAISVLLSDTNDPLIATVARNDQVAIFGSDDMVDELLAAHTTFLFAVTDGQGDDFRVDRAAYVRQIAQDRPIMILQGSHYSAARTGVIYNFSEHEIAALRPHMLTTKIFTAKILAPR